LQEVTRSGTAARAQAQLKRTDLYGKTATTNDAVDAWFAGFQPSVAAVVWMGYDNPRSLGSRESGGGLSLPVWIDFMRTALQNVPVQEPEAPEGLVQVDGEWLYDDWAAGGQRTRVGFDEPSPESTKP
jgi:penicillin-binding protein 1A